ncbi:MAG: hypothetical protein VKP62_13950 [Candidatus Sericytochromatia bacterium]|nr:hypothetical protein [Candidatus Sericytochromatia bacterium]
MNQTRLSPSTASGHRSLPPASAGLPEAWAPTHWNDSGRFALDSLTIADASRLAVSDALNGSLKEGPLAFVPADGIGQAAPPVWNSEVPLERLLEYLRPDDAEKSASSPLEPGDVQASAQSLRQRQRLAAIARRASANRDPDGRCYFHVWRFLQWAGGYGRVLQAGIPHSHSRYARQFADYANRNLQALGLKRLPLDNPYAAPAGAIVVVRPGAPGTGHPVAGDIAVADGQGRFFNGGEMSYGGPGRFPPGNNYVLGIYVPA